MKKLKINAAVCDIRNASAAKLEPFDSITINSALTFTSAESSQLLANYRVKMNCANILDCSGDVILKNGDFKLTGTGRTQEKTVLLVNGKLEVAPDAAEALPSYEKIQVNGDLLCPESLSNACANIQVNGNTVYYPDDAILFDGKIDKIFILRTEAGETYFTQNDVFLTDIHLDLSPLSQISILAPSAYVSSSLLPTAIKIFPRTTRIIEVPDNCCFLFEDVKLDMNLIRTKGTRLYIVGNAEITEREALTAVEYLHVTGTVYLPAEWQEEAKRFQFDRILLFTGKLLGFVPKFHLTKTFLENNTEGITLIDCAYVELDPEITAEEIRGRLHIIDCAVVKCSREQESAVACVSQNVAQILTQTEDTEEEEQDTDTQTINAAYYTL